MAPRPSIVGHDLKVYALLFQADLPHLENPYIRLGGRAGGFGRLLGQSCSHGEHIKCSPARAELATDVALYAHPGPQVTLLANVALLVRFLVWRAGWADRKIDVSRGSSVDERGSPLFRFGCCCDLEVADDQFHLAFEFDLVHGARGQQVASLVDGVAADGAFAVDDR